MSDDNKTTKPLKDPEINVDVYPKDRSNPAHKETADKVEKKLKEKVREAVKKNESGGQEKQFEAAGKETKKAGEGTDKNQIDKIKVRVSGKDEDGDRVDRGWSVTPKEGKPKP